MADDRLQFIFELVDRATGPTNSITASLKAAEKAMEGVAEFGPLVEKSTQGVAASWTHIAGGPTNSITAAMRAAEKSMQGVANFGSLTEDANKELGTSFASLAGRIPFVVDPLGAGISILRSFGDAAINLAESLGRVSFQMGSFAVDSLSFRENTLASFKLMFGTQEAADRIYNQAVKFAAATPFETKDVVAGYKQLASAGFGEKQLSTVFQALGDISASTGFSSEAFDHITRQFAQIKGRGVTQQQDINSIVDFSGQAGIGVTAILEGVQAATGKKVTSLGGLAADDFFSGFLKALELKNGAVGNVIHAQADTLKGVWSTVASFPSDAFLTMNLKDVAGFNDLKGALMSIRNLFDDDHDGAKRLQDLFKGSFNAVFSQLFGQFSGENGGVSKLSAILKVLESGFSYFVAGVRIGIGVIQGVVQGLSGTVSDIFDGPLDPAKVDELVASFTAFGVTLGKNIADIADLARGILKVADALNQVNQLVNPLSSLNAPGATGDVIRGAGLDLLKKSSGLGAAADFAGSLRSLISDHPMASDTTSASGPINAASGGTGGGRSVTLNIYPNAIQVDARGGDGSRVADETLDHFARRMSDLSTLGFQQGSH